MDAEDFSGVVEDSVSKLSRYGRRAFTGYKRGWYGLPTGQRMVFVTLVSGGVKLEGQSLGAYFVSRELAEDALDRSIKDYISPLTGNIHWRMPPTSYAEPFYKEDFDSLQSAQLAKDGKLVLAPQLMWYTVCRIAVDPFNPLAIEVPNA